MVKPVTISAPAGTNVIAAGAFLETDGAGAVKAFDGTGTILGRAESGFDPADPLAAGDEFVGCIKQGLIRVAAAAATYSFGDEVEWDTGHTVKAGNTLLVGTAAETKTTTSGDPILKVYMNIA